MRPDPNRRRPTITDAMILVAATAVGLALVRGYHESHFQPRPAMNPVGRCSIYVTPMLAAWSLGVLACGRRHGRPRRVARAPGTAACLAAALAVGCQGAFAAEDMAKLKSIGRATYVFGFVMSIPPAGLLAGFGVAAVWCQMAMAGRWRPEPTWVDRAGRILGAAWVATAAATGFEL